MFDFILDKTDTVIYYFGLDSKQTNREPGNFLYMSHALELVL